MYFELVPEAQRFVYVVSNGSEVWTEAYDREDTPSIIPVIEDFLRWLERHGLLETYEAFQPTHPCGVRPRPLECHSSD